MLVISITILYRKNIWWWRQWRKRDDKPPRGKKYLLKHPPNCKRHPSANNISDAGTVHVFVLRMYVAPAEICSTTPGCIFW